MHEKWEAAARQAEDKFGGEKLRGVRRSMAINMARSHAEVVPVTLYGDVDLHRWGSARDPLLRLGKAIAVACKAEPLLNAWFDSKSQSLKLHSHLDLGIAVDTPGRPVRAGAAQCWRAQHRAAQRGHGAAASGC